MSSIIAYLIPGLHLHFYFSTPLPDIVIICSPLHDFHVLIDSSVSVLNSFLKLIGGPRIWISLPRVAKGCACGILLQCGSWKLGGMEALVRLRKMGGTAKKVAKSGIGGRARTMAGAGPTDLLYGSRVETTCSVYAVIKRRRLWTLTQNPTIIISVFKPNLALEGTGHHELEDTSCVTTLFRPLLSKLECLVKASSQSTAILHLKLRAHPTTCSNGAMLRV